MNQKTLILTVALTAFVFAVSASGVNAQLGGMLNKTKDKAKNVENKAKGKDHENKAKPKEDKPAPKPDDKQISSNKTQAGGDETETRAENAKSLAKAVGMPKPANTDAALNKLLFQAADDHRLVPRRVVVADKDYMFTTDARGAKVRRIFAVIGRTQDDSSGKCAKQMVQFDQDWREERNAYGAVYVQNIGEIVPIACSAIGK